MISRNSAIEGIYDLGVSYKMSVKFVDLKLNWKRTEMTKEEYFEMESEIYAALNRAR